MASHVIPHHETFNIFINNLQAYLHLFETQVTKTQKSLLEFHIYNDKVGHLSKVDLLYPSTYNIDESTETFSDILPRSEQII